MKWDSDGLITTRSIRVNSRDSDKLVTEDPYPTNYKARTPKLKGLRQLNNRRSSSY